MSNIHVVKKQNHWESKKEGGKTSLTKHRTQENEIAKGKKIVENTGGGELVIHRVGRKIRDKNTYIKKDPYPPKG